MQKTRLGQYRLIHRIATGGMGEIYLARREGPADFEKTVVIKRILPHLAREETFIKKFLDEARIVVDLTHSHIVPVFDMGEEDGEYYLAMEYVPGRDLSGILDKASEQDRRLPPEMSLLIASEACQALGYAHRRTDEEGESLGIVHRDVSPSNILVSKEGETKLVDFGVARAADKLSQTMSGRIQGKCAYMSPEQAQGSRVDTRSDIFSTGVVLYEMLTGDRPFEGDTDLETLRLVRECQFVAPSENNENLPNQIDDILDKALSENPDDRYQEIDEFEADLVELMHQHFEYVRNQDLASYLQDLFPDGYEPPEYREILKESSSEKNLDDALEEQLEKISSQHERKTAERTATLPSELEDEVPLPSETDAQTETTASEQNRAFSVTSIVVSVVIIGSVVGGLTWLYWGGQSTSGKSKRGTLVIQSKPPGATVEIDNSQIHTDSGLAKTPFEYRLPEGRHQIRLKKKGYEPKNISIDIPPRKTVTLSAPQTKLNPLQKQKLRTFSIRTSPPESIVIANQEKIGQTPVKLEVAPDEVKNLRITNDNCEDKSYTLGYSHDQKDVSFELNCKAPEKQESQEEDNQSAQPSSPPQEPKREHKQLELASSPKGVTVQKNDAVVGKTPVEVKASIQKPLTLKLRKEGYRSEDKRLSVDELRDKDSFQFELEPLPKGCLNFSAVDPQLAKIAIDGKWLPQKKGRLKNYELPAGTHEITVKNEIANKPPETHTVEIKPGDDCTFLKIWDSK